MHPRETACRCRLFAQVGSNRHQLGIGMRDLHILPCLNLIAGLPGLRRSADRSLFEIFPVIRGISGDQHLGEHHVGVGLRSSGRWSSIWRLSCIKTSRLRDPSPLPGVENCRKRNGVIFRPEPRCSCGESRRHPSRRGIIPEITNSGTVPSSSRCPVEGNRRRS